jgi:predicted nucleic-acid-binding protein
VKQYVIDTNALISFVTDRNPQQQLKISEILNRAAQLKVMVLCPQNVLTEFIYVMDKVYGTSRDTIKKLIQDFIAMPGITIIHELDLQTVLTYWPDSIPDFGDAIVASVCRSNKKSAIVTFDQKFTRKLSTLGLEVG